MDNASPQTPTTETKPYSCKECQDSHKVRVQFVGADGVFDREVACPACGPEPAVTTPASRDASAYMTALQVYDKRLSLIAALAVVAAILAALAYMATRKDDNPFAQAVKEVTE